MITLTQHLNESLIEAFTVSDKGIVDSTLKIVINGKEYAYEPISLSVKDLHSKFKGILKYSQGKALTWLKKNAKHVSGGKLDDNFGAPYGYDISLGNSF